MFRLMIAACLLVVLPARAERTADPDPGAPAAKAFVKLRALAGSWIDTSGTTAGKGQVAVTYRVTGGGSAVVETIFPGAEHEMMSVYTREGDDIVMSHFCGMGNQPRMRARVVDDGRLEFAFDGGLNFNPETDLHMHEGTFTFVDADHIRAEWQTFQGKEPAAHRAVFELERSPATP